MYSIEDMVSHDKLERAELLPAIEAPVVLDQFANIVLYALEDEFNKDMNVVEFIYKVYLRYRYLSIDTLRMLKDRHFFKSNVDSQDKLDLLYAGYSRNIDKFFKSAVKILQGRINKVVNEDPKKEMLSVSSVKSMMHDIFLERLSDNEVDYDLLTGRAFGEL